MPTVQEHPHSFPQTDWPFPAPINALAISTTRVLSEGYPVLRVSHDSDGIWQVLCDTTTAAEDCKVVCLGCCFQLDPSLGQLADLPLGWEAWRSSASCPWTRGPSPPEDADEV